MIDGLTSITEKLSGPQQNLFQDVLGKETDKLAKAQLKDYKVKPSITARDRDMMQFTGPEVMGFLMLNNTLKALMKQVEVGSGLGSRKGKGEGEGDGGFSLGDMAEEAGGDLLANLIGKTGSKWIGPLLKKALPAIATALPVIGSALLPYIAIAAGAGLVGYSIFKEFKEGRQFAEDNAATLADPSAEPVDSEGNFLNAPEARAARAEIKEWDKEDAVNVALGRYAKDYLKPGTWIQARGNGEIWAGDDPENLAPIEGGGLTKDEAIALFDNISTEDQKAWKPNKKYSEFLSILGDQNPHQFHTGGYVPGNPTDEVSAILLGQERVLSHKELSMFGDLVKDERADFQNVLSNFLQGNLKSTRQYTDMLKVSTGQSLDLPAAANISIVPVDYNAIKDSIQRGMQGFQVSPPEAAPPVKENELSLGEFKEACRVLKEAASHLAGVVMPAPQPMPIFVGGQNSGTSDFLSRPLRG